MDQLKSILDALPLNNYKSWIGFCATALILGFEQMGVLDTHTAGLLLSFATALTGVGLLHKEMKAADVPPAV